MISFSLKPQGILIGILKDYTPGLRALSYHTPIIKVKEYFMYELISLFSVCLSVSLTVYVHMLRQQLQRNIGEIANIMVSHSERLEDLAKADREFIVHAESVARAISELESKSPTERGGLSMEDIYKNISSGAISSADFGDSPVPFNVVR